MYCYCGHLMIRHDQVCRGQAKGQCPCPSARAFPTGVWKHVKSGGLYSIIGLGFNSEDRTIVEVEYESLSHGERWHRPLYSPDKTYGFLENDLETGNPRFEHVPDPVEDFAFP